MIKLTIQKKVSVLPGDEYFDVPKPCIVLIDGKIIDDEGTLDTPTIALFQRRWNEEHNKMGLRYYLMKL